MVILATTNPKEIASCIKRIRQRKLLRRRKTLPELKGYNLTSRELRYALKELEKCDCQIYSALTAGRGFSDRLTTHTLYAEMASQLIAECRTRIPIKELVIDRRGTKKAQLEFDEYVQNMFTEDFSIRHEDSKKVAGLQGADLVGFAIRRKAQKKDAELYNLIRSKIVWKGISQKRA